MRKPPFIRITPPKKTKTTKANQPVAGDVEERPAAPKRGFVPFKGEPPVFLPAGARDPGGDREEMTRQQNRLLNTWFEMRPGLRGVARSFDDLQLEARRSEFGFKFKMASMCRAVWADEKSFSAQGLDLLARWLGCSPQELYEAIHVSEVFTLDQLLGMLNEKLADGSRLSWDHIVILSQVQSSNQRQDWTTRAFLEGLSASKLSKLIRQEHKDRMKRIREKYQVGLCSNDGNAPESNSASNGEVR